MNGIQKYLHEKMIEALYKSAGELISNAKINTDVVINPNDVSKSLIELENTINSNLTDFKSEVECDIEYATFKGSSSSFVDVS